MTHLHFIASLAIMLGNKAMDILWIVIVVLCSLSHHVAISTRLSSFKKLDLPPRVSGPEALAFDFKGEGPYTGVLDGRILKYQESSSSFVDFATTSPLRTRELCDGVNNTSLGLICGRPLGISFNYLTRDLYVVDPFFGLLEVGSNGGLATQLAAGVDGMPFAFANAVDVDSLTGNVYFTDSGSIFRLSNTTQLILSGDTSGKLLKYDPMTQRVTVLLSGLSGPAGVAISKDGTFVLVTEYIGRRIRRFWLKGPRANSSDILVNLSGSPDNIKRTILGDFWVAVNILNLQPMSMLVPIAQRINSLGLILETISLSDLDQEYVGASVSEIQEYAGRLFIGSLIESFVGEY